MVPALAPLLRASLAREHTGPPRLPAWTWRPLLDGCMALFANVEKGWSLHPDRLPLIANNAASWLVWQLGGGTRGLAALTVAGERIDREFGVEAALGAAETLAHKLARSGEDPVPLDAMAGRQRLGADNLVSLHRRQLHWERLRLRHAAGRISGVDLDTLAAEPVDVLVEVASRVGAPAASAPPEEGCANPLCWAAGAWFWESWERLEDPSFLWWIGDWFRATFGGAGGGDRGGERPPHGGPAEANWRHEALLQIRFRTAFCLGLGTALERALVALDPSLRDAEDLPAPDRAPRALRVQVATALEEVWVPRALALLRDRAFSLSDLSAEARSALLRVLGRRADGRLYRVDSQLPKLPGEDNEARGRALFALCRALGAAVAQREGTQNEGSQNGSKPGTGGPMNPSDPACGHREERKRIGSSALRSVEQIGALRALVEGCPDCRAWWTAQSAGEVLAAELVDRVPMPRRARPAYGLVLLPMAAAAAAAWLLWPHPPPVLTTLAGGAQVSGSVVVEDGASHVQHPLREQDAELRLVAPAEAWVSFNPNAVRLPDAGVSEATLLAWAASGDRVDLVACEHLVRGPDGIATHTATQPAQQVQVGEGLDLVVAVLPGTLAVLPASVSPGTPLGALPAGAVVHHVHIDPAP